MPQVGFFDLRGLEKIFSDSASANRRSGGADPLKERTLSENVQIPGVRMIGLIEFSTRGALPSPISTCPLDRSIIEAPQASHPRLGLTLSTEAARRHGSERSGNRRPQNRDLLTKGEQAHAQEHDESQGEQDTREQAA